MRQRLQPRLGLQTGRPEEPTRPVWQIVAVLYGAIGLLVMLVIALAFLAALAVAGRAFA